MGFYLACLLGCRCACPQRIKGTYVLVSRLLSSYEVVIEIAAFFRVPQVVIHGGSASLGCLVPSSRFVGFPELFGHPGQVALVFVEKCVQANGGIVMRRSVEGAKAEAGIEAGFAHAAVAFVEVSAEPMRSNVSADTDGGSFRVAALLHEPGAIRGPRLLRSLN